MVLGILSVSLLPLGCCCGLGLLLVIPLGIGGVVLGFMARGRVTASQGALGGSGKALAGIVTGGTAIAIALMLFAIEVAWGLGGGTLLNRFATPSPSG
jgi:hypothetical protein